MVYQHQSGLEYLFHAHGQAGEHFVKPVLYPCTLQYCTLRVHLYCIPVLNSSVHHRCAGIQGNSLLKIGSRNTYFSSTKYSPLLIGLGHRRQCWGAEGGCDNLQQHQLPLPRRLGVEVLHPGMMMRMVMMMMVMMMILHPGPAGG